MIPLVIFVDDLETHASTQYAFIKSPVRIGRSELNDLPLPVGFVSGWHAVVRFNEEEIHYVDLGSTNGSLLNGARLEKNVPILVSPQTEIGIGTLRLRFTRREIATRLTPPPRPMTAFALRVSQLNLAVVRPEEIAPLAGVVATEQAIPAGEVAQPPIPAPIEPPTKPPLEPQQIEMVEQALTRAAMDLDLLYASYRGSWEHLRGAVDQLITSMDQPARQWALSRLGEKYRALLQEPQFQVIAGQGPMISKEPAPDAVPALKPMAALPAGREALGLLAAFAESYLPDPEPASTEAGAERLLGRTAEVLEAFGRSYLELRKGYEEFGKEMGVRAIREDRPVERARDVKQLLAYLLDLRAVSRTPDLQSAYADLMVHQVALLNGVVEGARGMLERLSPETVTGEAGPSRWPLKAGAYWKAYEERWHEIADEEDAISDVLFGAEFVRAYTAIVGQHAGDDKPPAADSTQPHQPSPKRPMPAR